MSSRHDAMELAADGFLRGVTIIGYQGQIAVPSTPARREAVLLDDRRRVVEILGENKDEHGSLINVVVERSRPLAKGENPPGVVTLITPLPARIGDIVTIFSRRDLELLPADMPPRRAE